MHSFIKTLFSLPYRTKLILVFSFLIVLTASILGSITYYHFAESSKREAEEYQVQLVTQINHNFDRYLKEMQIISLSPLYDQKILSILNNHLDPVSEASFPPADERIEMWRYISSLIHMRNEIKGIHIMANDGTIFSNLDSNTVWLKLLDIDDHWVSSIKNADGEWVLLPLHQPKYYLNQKTEVFSVARLIREPSTNKHLGIIKLDLKQELFEDFIESDRNIYVLDKDNDLIYTNDDQEKIKFIIPRIENSYVKANINKKSYMMVYHQSLYSGVKVIMLTPLEIILSEMHQLRILLILGVLCGILISFILGFVLSKPLVGSIHRLQKAMAEVKKGDLSKRVDSFYDDEIGQLSQGFNHMVDEIDRLVSEVYETGLREKDAEIRALQSQMNPHFLYNTLESINMLAITKGNLDVSDMVTSLGKLLRYTIDHSAKIVTLQEELGFIHSYIMIQQKRMGEDLQYEEEVEAHLLNTLIPKIILQPLIENAIIHGISGRRGLISLKVKEINHEMVVIITGKGINKKNLRELRGAIQTNKTSNKSDGIALVNVNERIQFLYGPSYGIELKSEEGKGFIVTLRFPIKEGD